MLFRILHQLLRLQQPQRYEVRRQSSAGGVQSTVPEVHERQRQERVRAVPEDQPNHRF